MRAELPALPDGIVVEIGELVDLPEDRDAWVAEALAGGEPAHRTSLSTHRTATGWPVTLIGAQVGDETRIVLFFELGVHGALVRVRIAAGHEAAWPTSGILEALLAGQIRLHPAGPVAIAELLEI